MDDRRNFSRVKFLTNAQIDFNNTTYPVNVIDIALNGALLHSEINIPLALKSVCELKVNLAQSDIVLDFVAEVVHREQNNLGVKFIRKDIDTMIHLRRLLELNVGDYERISKELSFLIRGPDSGTKD